MNPALYSLIQEAINQVRNKFYKKERLFTVEEHEKNIRFGTKDELFSLHVITDGYMMLSRHTFSIHDERMHEVLNVFKETFEGKLDVLIQSIEIIGIGKETKSLAKVFKFAIDNLCKDWNPYFPLYTVIPSTFTNQVFILQNRNQKVATFKTMKDVEDFIEREKEILLKINNFEKGIDSLIKSIHPDVAYYKVDNSTEHTYIIESGESLTFSIYKEYKDEKEMFTSRVFFRDSWKTISEESLEEVFKEIKKITHLFLK